jgi:hypothetical protein
MRLFNLFFFLITFFCDNDIISYAKELEITKTPKYNEYKEGWYLHDVLAHCPNKQELIDNKFNEDFITWSHEGSHQVNAFNSVYGKQQAIYLTNGGHAVIKDPGVQYEKIRELVPKTHYTFKTYFIDQPEQNRKYRIQAKLDGYVSTMYLFDEHSAYINGALVGNQYKLQGTQSEVENAYIFTLYCGYVLYYCESHGVPYDEQILLLYKHQFSRLKSISSDEKHLRTLREDKIGKFLEKILDLSPKKGV